MSGLYNVLSINHQEVAIFQLNYFRENIYFSIRVSNGNRIDDFNYSRRRVEMEAKFMSK